MVQFSSLRLSDLEAHQTQPEQNENVSISILKGQRTCRCRPVKMETTSDCKLRMSWLPWMAYNALDGGANGKYLTFTRNNSNKKTMCEHHMVKLDFDTDTARIPPLNFHTTAILGLLPLPPFINVEITPNQLSGWLDKQTGRLQLMYDASFTLKIGSWTLPGSNSKPFAFYPGPPLVVKTVLTTEPVQLSENGGSSGVLQGKRMDSEGYATLVGAAIVPATDHLVTNILLQLPGTATAQMSCRFKLETDDSDCL